MNRVTKVFLRKDIFFIIFQCAHPNKESLGNTSISEKDCWQKEMAQHKIEGKECIKIFNILSFEKLRVLEWDSSRKHPKKRQCQTQKLGEAKWSDFFPT